jgi:hypothetical protein
MKKLFLFTILFSLLTFVSCDDETMYIITTDHSGYAEEYLKIPTNGKIKFTYIDALCGEVNKGGRIYKTHYQVSLRELTVFFDCYCDNFIPTEYFKVEKGDKIRLIIQNGEVTTRYKIKYDFIENK